MLTLQIAKPIEYFSPTGFIQSDNCELEFWIMRMSGMDLKRLPQTIPMAAGSAFDSFIKYEIAHLMGKTDDKTNELATLLNSVDPDQKEIIPEGKRLADLYIKAGCLRRLMNEGLHDIELDEKFKGPFGTPIYAKPDASIKHGDVYIPTDWKVNGYNSKTGASPKPGYFRCIDIYGQDKGTHEKFGCLMEDIDRNWAIQLIFYHWMLNPDYTGTMQGAIEQVAIRGETVLFASYRAQIGKPLIMEVTAKLNDKWKRFNAGQFKEPTVKKFICHAYGQVKKCTLICPFYDKVMQNPETKNEFYR